VLDFLTKKGSTWCMKISPLISTLASAWGLAFALALVTWVDSFVKIFVILVGICFLMANFASSFESWLTARKKRSTQEVPFPGSHDFMD